MRAVPAKFCFPRCQCYPTRLIRSDVSFELTATILIYRNSLPITVKQLDQLSSNLRPCDSVDCYSQRMLAAGFNWFMVLSLGLVIAWF